MNPENPNNEVLPAPNIIKVMPDISNLTAEERKAVFEILNVKNDEEWASEALTSEQSFSPEEQEILVSLISDPYLSFEVLTVTDIGGEKLTPAQREKLMKQIESDEDVAQSFYLQLVESGVAMEPNETEKWYLIRLEKLLKKTDNPEIAAYALEHDASLSKADRKRLEKLL